MDFQDQSKRIQEIYDEAIAKLTVLGNERNNLIKKRQDIIQTYIKELEVQKIDAIRASLSLMANN